MAAVTPRKNHLLHVHLRLPPLGTGNRGAKILRYCLHLTAVKTSPLVASGWTASLLRMEMFSIINSSKISQKVGGLVGSGCVCRCSSLSALFPSSHRRASHVCLVAREHHVSLFFFFIGPKRINLLVAMEVPDCRLLSEAVLKGSPMRLVLSNNSCCREKKKRRPSLRSLNPFSGPPTHICGNNGVNLMVAESR